MALTCKFSEELRVLWEDTIRSVVREQSPEGLEGWADDDMQA